MKDTSVKCLFVIASCTKQPFLFADYTSDLHFMHLYKVSAQA